MSIKTLATVFDGEGFMEVPKLAALRKHEERLKRYQRIVSHRVKGSKRRDEAKRCFGAPAPARGVIRKDHAHKATTAIVAMAKTIKVETLNMRGMLKNHNLAQSVADASMGMFLN